MRTLALVAVALFAVSGCSEDEATPSGTTDTGTTADSSTTDTGTKEDTSPADTAKNETAADSSTDSAADAPKDTFTCEVGMLCNEMQPCPGTLRCYGSAGNGFCAPAEPECGGFVMKMCAGGRVCLRGGGSSLGYCATPEEKPCICDAAKAPDAGFSVDGC